MIIFHVVDCKYSGLPRSDPAEEGRQGGVLHEHPEYRPAGAEVSFLTCENRRELHEESYSCLYACVLSQVPQWDSRVHEVCGPGSAETISPG